MITASKKRKENIAEYLLYMWQIEDIIRANGLDMSKIKSNILDHYTGLDERQLKEMADWYESMIDMMRREGVVEKGHIQMNQNIISDLEHLNSRLLKDPQFAEYSSLYYSVLPDIVEIRSKAGDNKRGEIESAFTALYGLLLLRLQKKQISAPTLAAADRISKFLARLATYYKEDEEGKLFKND